jgi:hypothetical protein
MVIEAPATRPATVAQLEQARAKRPPHKEVAISINGETVFVDVGVKTLVEALNSIPGIHTLNSCQGGWSAKENCHHDGYVQFRGPASRSLIVHLLDSVLEGEWLNGLKFESSARLNSHTIRWLTFDYPRLVKACECYSLQHPRKRPKRDARLPRARLQTSSSLASRH